MTKPNSLLKRFKRTLLSGVFVVGPFSLSFMILAWFVSSVNTLLAPVAGLFGRDLPGIGLAVAFLIVLGLGALANNIMGQHLLEYFEELLLKIPGFNWVYRTIKQMTEVFSPANKNAFRRVVLVEYPRPSVYSLGFVTRDLQIEREGKIENFVCVYVPTNHMYIGDIVLLPASQVLSTPLTLQEGIQCAVSAGASLPSLMRTR